MCWISRPGGSMISVMSTMEHGQYTRDGDDLSVTRIANFVSY